jgi:hypothetical protein
MSKTLIAFLCFAASCRADALPTRGAVIIGGTVASGPDSGQSWALQFAWDLGTWDGTGIQALTTVPTTVEVGQYAPFGHCEEFPTLQPCIFALGFLTPGWGGVFTNLDTVTIQDNTVIGVAIAIPKQDYGWYPSIGQTSWYDDFRGDSGLSYLISVFALPEPCTLALSLFPLLLWISRRKHTPRFIQRCGLSS